MPKKILVVDDESTIADTLAIILRNLGYEVVAVYDAQSAIERCESLTPDLIISDVAMPGLDGIEMAILIRERHPTCRILLFSGYAVTLDLLEKARQRGHHFEVLAKPIHPKDLLSKIAERPEIAEPSLMTLEQNCRIPGWTDDVSREGPGRGR